MRLILVFVILSLSHPALAQSLDVSAKLDSSHILIGDWFTLTLTAKGSASEITFPSPVDTLGPFEVVETGDTKKEGGVLTRTYVLTAFDTGRIHLRGIPVQYRVPGDTGVAVAYSNPVSIQVSGVEIDTTKSFRDIKEVLHVPLTIWDYLLYTGILLLLALLAWLVYRWYRRRNQEGEEEHVAEPVRPPDLVALEKLRELRERHLWEHGHVKEYQSALSEILREYIENRFDIPALESTTGELLDYLQRLGVARFLQDEARQMLYVSDMTKFAKYKPAPDEHRKGLSVCLHFVEETRPRVTAVEEETVEIGDAAKDEVKTAEENKDA
ncbi:MAG: protein BatD [Chlorobi bacterium]|nr:protein BatD [Chlorobiota bacterium]